MKKEFSDYLKAVGLTDQFYERAGEILDLYEQIYPSQLIDIFVSEYADQEGTRHYENLWMFTPNAACEAKQFLTEDNLDALAYRKMITYWTVQKVDYDFKNASPTSRMSVHFIVTGVTGTLKASSNNCDALRNILLKHIVTNMCK
jgi:hypothetical protein